MSLQDYGVDHVVDVDEAKSWHDAEERMWW
jgi:hypothetical protein